MKITILTIGSRGDLHPMTALGRGLQRSGHRVTLATHLRFEASVRQAGLDFALLRADPKEMLESHLGQAALTAAGPPLHSFIHFARAIRPVIRQLGRDCLAACRDAEAVIFGALGFLHGPSVADAYQIPQIAALLQPLDPTRAFPQLNLSVRSLGGWLNRFSYVIGGLINCLPFQSSINHWRQTELGLPPLPVTHFFRWRDEGHLTLYGYSPAVLPRPPEWGPNVHVTGYWFPAEPLAGWRPPSSLLNFLSAGPPPVYVGFGSMPAPDPAAITALVLEALARAGQRGVLLTGWGGLSDQQLPADAYPVAYVPHAWLFPRMGAVVHHGGAGTTAAGLRAGVPSILTPFFADQPFWGRRVAELGVGPPPIPRGQLTTERLAVAIIQAAGDRQMKQRAAALSAQIQAEDGVGRSVKLIDAYLG